MPDRSKQTDDEREERDDAKRGGRKPKPGQQPAERPEWPKPFVRLTRQADGPGGFGCEVRLVGDADGVGSAKDEGYAEVDPRAGVLADFVEFPKWQYHPDGRREIVYSQDDADALEGYGDIPVDETAEAEAKAVAPSVAQATAGSLKGRPPTPPDRG